MDISFLTLSKNANKTIRQHRTHFLEVNRHATTGLIPISGRERPIVMDWARSELSKPGQKVKNIFALQHEDVKGFGNALYYIETTKKDYLLKVVDSKHEGNGREPYVWLALGYNDPGHKKKPRPGLPKDVCINRRLGSILMPFMHGRFVPPPGKYFDLATVMAMIIQVSKTLAHMHQHGLVFMDLCPENVLFMQGTSVVFYLTDMGSVKPLRGMQPIYQEAFSDFLQEVTPERLTRVEVMPQYGKTEKLGRFESDKGYDYACLAQTALIALGFTNRPIDKIDISYYEERFDLEDPMKPKRSEVQRLLDHLKKMKRFQPTDPRLFEDFKSFFKQRVDYVSQLPHQETVVNYWHAALMGSLNRHHFTLSPKVWQRLTGMLNTTQQNFPMLPESDNEAIQSLRKIPALLLQRNWEETVAQFRILEGSDVLKTFPTASYAYRFHRKVLLLLARGVAPVRAFLGEPIPTGIIDAGLDQLPEQETLRELRQNPDIDLGILTRQVGA